jgi:hypothetical protein
MTNGSGEFWDAMGYVFPKSELGDLAYSLIKFVRVHRRFPSRNRPLFNDQIFYSKIAPEIMDPLRLYSTDKEYFKKLVAAELGKRYVVPTLSILRSESEIDEFDFPDSFCAKPTHMSGEVQIVRDGQADRSRMKQWLKMNHYLRSRERNYRYLKPKVIVEPLLFNDDDITDYRIFCYMGKPRLICVDIGKYTKYTRAMFTTDWVQQQFSLGYPMHEDTIARPNCLDAMLVAAATLSRDLSFVRVDFYTNGEQFFLGELTHAHASASQQFIPKSAEVIASAMIFNP